MPGSFIEELELAGWSKRSIWGYDELMDSYFARLWPDSDPDSEEPAIWISGIQGIYRLDDLADRVAAETGASEFTAAQNLGSGVSSA